MPLISKTISLKPPFSLSEAEMTSTGQRRVSRGGSWRHQIKFSRCAARSSLPPGFKYADYGFRVALTTA